MSYPPRPASRLSRFIKLFGLLLVVILLAAGAVRFFYSSSPQPTQASDTPDRFQVAGPLATAQVNQEFSFPLRDADLNEVSTIKYQIETVEKRNEIIVRGQKARAVEGRTFLILNIKITNSFDQAIEIDSRDYVRLVINGNQEEKFAPEIHNDPVEVQAISVKNTRLGYAIDADVTDLTLLIGEIDSEKQEIKLEFNN